ncbi:MAG: hypothetical protein M1829_005220 [Trizodia sp. TS-e1964]|nr:MAG: hypothetical protein M1829_005220 [Trizodia sp. TS-e1964]
MTMTLDNQHQRHLVNLPSYPYAHHSPQFTDPWTGAAATAPIFQSHLHHSSMGFGALAKQPAAKANPLSLPYSSLPSMAPSNMAAGLSYGHNELLATYPSGTSTTSTAYSSTAAGPAYTVTAAAYDSSNYNPRASFALQAPPLSKPVDQAPRRISDPAMLASHAQRDSYVDILGASQGMLAMSQDITPRNIYGNTGRVDRLSTDYGFPPTHSSSSSISSASSHAYYEPTDGSITDYSSASEHYDSLSASRKLPLPEVGALGLPAAAMSMMGQFNSKLPTTCQKRHKCKVCDKRFTRPSSLQTHMYSHTGEKPFSCECGRSFSVVSNLRRHRKVHKQEGDAESPDEE